MATGMSRRQGSVVALRHERKGVKESGWIENVESMLWVLKGNNQGPLLGSAIAQGGAKEKG